MYESWLAVFRPHCYGVTRMNARSLDVLADNLPAHHMAGDHTLRTFGIHPIIQSGRTARTRERRKPAAQRGHWCGRKDLPHQDVGALCTAPDASLPEQLGVLARAACLQRVREGVVKHRGAATIPALRPPANHDLETTYHRLLSVTGVRRHVNRRFLHMTTQRSPARAHVGRRNV